MNNQNLIILILTTLIYSTSETLTVLKPEALQKKFPNGIPYSLSNFGKIPYGNRVISEAIKSNPIELCTE